MKNFILILIILLSFSSRVNSQTVFDFSLANGTSVVNNVDTGFTEVIQIIGGLEITIKAVTGDVYLQGGKVVSDDDQLWFEFNADVILNNFVYDKTQNPSQSLWVEMYDTFNILIGGHISQTISTGIQSDNILNNSLTNGLISKVWLDFTDIDFAFSQVNIDSNNLGITDSSFNPLNIYPNPIIDNLNINGNIASSTIIIYDSLGKVVLDGNTTKKIDMSFLSEGIYIVRISHKYKSNTYKFIKL